VISVRLKTHKARRAYHLSPIIRHAFAARALATACLALLLSGCANLGYYLQSVSGQFDLWRRERPIEEVVNDPATPETLRRKLTAVVEIRAFASRELRLPDNRSYRLYADLGRPYVVWNVFATEEFSVQPAQWCFLMVGCVSYRGYFSKDDADRFATELGRQGYDVYVGPVPAYSTLGWFPDPVLNTFIHYPVAEIARLVFHELTHQVVYVRDDTVFNESLAVAVEQEGVRRWLTRAGDAQQKSVYERTQRIRAAFVQLVRKHRERLDELYRTELAPEEMRARKMEILRNLEQEYEAIKLQDWGGFAGYDPWFARKPNNAQLASIAIYTQMVPAFQALLEREGGDLLRFHAAVRALAGLPKAERTAQLIRLAPQVARDLDSITAKPSRRQGKREYDEIEKLPVLEPGGRKE
jgi:predicted aminopeptidase